MNNKGDRDYFFPRLWVNSSLLALVWFGLTPDESYSQITPDGTLGSGFNSIVTPDQTINPTVFNITGGQTQGSSLFHSFTDFNVPVSTTASFQNSPSVEQIFSRVTGGNASTISGTIQTVGSADLFLLNPAGIIFNEGASLKMEGSFFATTATALDFGNGQNFSATNPQPAPLLSVGVPLGLQLNNTSQNIQVKGRNNGLILNEDYTFVTNFAKRGLTHQTPQGQTIALIANGIDLDGGNITAPGGSIDLWSVGAGTVKIEQDNNNFTFKEDGVVAYSDFKALNSSSVNASASKSGTIDIHAHNIDLNKGSIIFSNTRTGDGGGINVNAIGSLNLDGIVFDFFQNGPPNIMYSGIAANVNPSGSGQGGAVTVKAAEINVTNGARISTETFGIGNGGHLMITGRDRITTDGAAIFGPSGFFTAVRPVQTGATSFQQSSGNSGNLKVTTDYLSMTGGSQIFASTFSNGSGGNLTIEADRLELKGTIVPDPSFPRREFPTLLAAESAGAGKGGNLTINNALATIIADGAEISVSARNKGDAGELTVNSDLIELTGGTANLASTIASNSLPGASGKAGKVTLNVQQLSIFEGAQVSTSTNTNAPGGLLDINAQTINISGKNEQGSSGLFASALIQQGQGGNIKIESDRLLIDQEGIISASNFPSSLNSNKLPGTGAAGSINITLKETLRVGNQGGIKVRSQGGMEGNIIITAPLITLDRGIINASAEGLAQGGSITINGNNLYLLQNSQIIANSDSLISNTQGGNVVINTDNIIALKNSDITANSNSSFGGKVTITTRALIGTAFREQLTAQSDITASSALGAEFKGVVEIKSPENDPSAGIVELATDTVDVDRLIAPGCPIPQLSRLVVTGKGGLAPSPMEPLQNSIVWQDLRSPQPPTPLAHHPDSPNQVNMVWQDLSVPITQAQNWRINETGDVELIALKSSEMSYSPGNCSYNNQI